MAYNLPGYQFPMTNIIPPHILERGRNNRVLGLGWDSDDDFDDFGPRGTLQSSQLVAPSPSTSSSIFPTSHPNNALTYFSNSPVTGGSSQSPPLYYHTDRHTKHRNQQRFSESRFGSGGSYSRSLTSDTGMVPERLTFSASPFLAGLTRLFCSNGARDQNGAIPGAL